MRPGAYRGLVQCQVPAKAVERAWQDIWDHPSLERVASDQLVAWSAMTGSYAPGESLYIEQGAPRGGGADR